MPWSLEADSCSIILYVIFNALYSFREIKFDIFFLYHSDQWLQGDWYLERPRLPLTHVIYKLSSAKDRPKLFFYYMVVFWTGNFQNGVIFKIIDNVSRWSERYHLSLMKICHDLADWLHLGLGWLWGFLNGDLEDGFIFDIINHVSRR